jgi:O-antigen/teichoic acid export membrane protein
MTAGSTMNAYYVLALVAGRVFTVLTVVALSYILNSHDFGIFVIIATNALLIHILAFSWISNSSWKDVSSLSGADQKARISNSLEYAALLSLFPLLAAAALLAVDFGKFQYVALTLIVAVVTLFYELLLVISNARGRSRDYSFIALSRGLLSSALAVSLALAGFGVWGAVGGQIAGTVLTIICRKSFWEMWSRMEPRRVSRYELGAQLKFGLISAFALNLYLMGSALCRNFILIWLGEAEAGYFGLSADLFYAPIALLATALSLSSIPQLYRSAGKESGASHASDFLAGVLAVSIPYALAGPFVGPALADLFLRPAMSEPVSQIAAYSIIQAACFCVLSTQTTIALTQGRLKIAIGVPVATLALLASALWGTSLLSGGSASLVDYAGAVTVGLAAMTMLVLLASRPLLQVSILWGEGLRIVIAAMAMALVLASLAIWPLPFAPFPAIALGGATFVGAAWLLGSRIVRSLLRVSVA